MQLKYISWLPAMIVMVVIFYFSSKPAEDSSKSSECIAEEILEVYENIIDHQFSGSVRDEKIGIINHIVRKGAHISEYALLALTLAFHFFVWRKKIIKVCAYAAGIGIFYAATDEFHQLFVSGRGGQIRDVLIDSIGVALGILIFLFILRIGKALSKPRPLSKIE